MHLQEASYFYFKLMANKKVELLNSTELGRLINLPPQFKDIAIIEYIDLLHNALMDYQLFMDTIKSNIEDNDKDVKYAKL